ncbi:hypothetical protein C0991_004566 [Blastosporella zonata]|nr:hypothetical protein C0991_004566 [Blastosporella zonata]
MPPQVYNALKRRLLPRIQELYRHAKVPREVPEKSSYGDLDILVACPTAPGLSLNVPPDVVQNIIGAKFVKHSINKTTNFAVPIPRGEWEAFNLGKEEYQARRAADGKDIFYQVDINLCADEADHERTVFFHGYGDLGVMMSVTGRNVDPAFVIGEKGLRLSISPYPHFELSHSMDDITKFMGWSMDAWKAGFRTNREAFEWIGTSRFFNPIGFRTQRQRITKVLAHRAMYAEFAQWVTEKASVAASSGLEHDSDDMTTEQRQLAFREHALDYFNKKHEFDALVCRRGQRARLKEVFNSANVRDWANLGNDWQSLKLIMEAVREKLGGEEGVLKLYDESGESGVKQLVLEVQKQVLLLRQ